jgi:hypothetical protein
VCDRVYQTAPACSRKGAASGAWRRSALAQGPSRRRAHARAAGKPLGLSIDAHAT